MENQANRQIGTRPRSLMESGRRVWAVSCWDYCCYHYYYCLLLFLYHRWWEASRRQRKQGGSSPAPTPCPPIAHLGPGPQSAPGAAQTPAAGAAGAAGDWSYFWLRAGFARGRRGRRSGGPGGASAAPSRRGGWLALPAAESPGLAPSSPAR